MQENFTTEDLIRFIYHETNASETMAINEAMETNADLYETYENLMDAFQKMPRVQFSPSTKSLDNILNYSKHTTLV